MRSLRIVLALIVSMSAAVILHAQSENADKEPAELMADLRQMMLTSEPGNFGFDQKELEQVAYGAVMEMPIGNGETATIVSFADGGGSLYTTGSYGIMGGIGHESVRQASKRFVELASKAADKGASVTEFPYPQENTVHIYILTFDGVVQIVEKTDRLGAQVSPHMKLFNAGQDVLTQLRLMVEEMERSKNSPVDSPAP